MAVTLPAFSQSAPTAPVAPTAPSPVAMIATTDTGFSAGVRSALGAATTNIVYIQQTGNTPIVNILQDGNANRVGANAAGAINPMLLDGSNQTVTAIQQGNGNLINTLQLVTTSGASAVQIQQLGNSNTVNAFCGDSTSNCNNANINWRFSGNTNSVNFTGQGNALTSGIDVLGNGNAFAIAMSGDLHQQLVNVRGDNNTFNLSQTAAMASSLVINQNGTGATFNVSQSGTYAGVVNIQSAASGGSFNITQVSHR